jgi:hypothetical protein
MANNNPLKKAKELRERMEPDGFMHRGFIPESDFQPLARMLFDELIQLVENLTTKVEQLKKKG